jgi:shikimate dehydrogenase
MLLPTAETTFALLLGDPVAHSRSPTIHNAAFRAQGLDAVYLAARVEAQGVGAAVAGLRALGALGANVTIPHKTAVIPHLDALTDRARAIGAVNTLVPAPGGRLTGDNTDAPGFLQPLEARGLDAALTGAPMLIFGAGGAARAVAYALLTALAPARLTLAVRTPAKAEALAADLAPHDPGAALAVTPMEAAGPALRDARLVVNATPLGMHPKPEGTPWARAGDFGPGHVVYDLVYAPRPTRLVREAAAAGATTLDGLAMLVGQAAVAYHQWTGRPMPLDAVYAALEAT